MLILKKVNNVVKYLILFIVFNNIFYSNVPILYNFIEHYLLFICILQYLYVNNYKEIIQFCVFLYIIINISIYCGRLFFIL